MWGMLASIVNLGTTKLILLIVRDNSQAPLAQSDLETTKKCDRDNANETLILSCPVMRVPAHSVNLNRPLLHYLKKQPSTKQKEYQLAKTAHACIFIILDGMRSYPALPN